MTSGRRAWPPGAGLVKGAARACGRAAAGARAAPAALRARAAAAPGQAAAALKGVGPALRRLGAGPNVPRRGQPLPPLFRKALLAAVVLAAALLALASSPAGTALEVQVSHRFLFWARSLVGGPGVATKLKIFAFDDVTAARLGDLDLPLGDWGKVIGALAARRPARIFIDKLFDKPYAPADAAAFVAQSRQWAAPVSVISFASHEAIAFRRELPEAAGVLRLARLMGDGGGSAAPPAWLAERGTHLYGFQPALAPAFSSIGHAVYDGDGYARAFFRAGERLLPHIGLVGAGALTLVGGRLSADGVRVPLDGTGRILVNFDRPEAYAARSYSMLALIDRARSGQEIPVVDAGDVVVLLPAMYTGNTDWRETPFGSLPGGYTLTAVLSSQLTNAWLRPLDDHGLGILLGCLAAVAAGMVLPPVWLGAALALVTPLVLLAACAAFVLWGLVLPWLLPLSATALTVAFVLTERYRTSQLESVRIEKELETAIIVQATFFPGGEATSSGLRIEGVVKPASECGGDWWGHFPAGPGRECVLVGDATGHGVSAALVTAMVFSVAGLLARLQRDGLAAFESPGRILRLINDVLAADAAKTSTMTMFAATLDLAAGRIVYANAAHVNPYLVPAAAADPRLADGQRVLKLRARGDVLGFRADGQFMEKDAEFKPGDRLLFYTDGLTECAGGPKGEPWRDQGLRQSLVTLADADARTMRDGVLRDFLVYSHGYVPDDDVTVVAAEFKA